MAKRTTKAKGAGGVGGRKRGPVGCLVWVALMLAIAVGFFALRASIARSIDASRLTRAVGAGKPGQREPAAAPTPQAQPAPAPAAGPASPAPAAEPRAAPQSAAPTPRATQPQSARPSPAAATPKQAAKQQPAPAPDPTPRQQTRRSTLYFAKVADTGAITVSGLPRSITFTDAPLTDTLEALVAGPIPAEQSRGYRTLIPSGTRIEEVRVVNGTAFVSFNEPFRFNSYGREAMEAQLEQIVYTATEFGNVRSVQVLIGGKVTDFLGQEGVRIRDPLTRESFAEDRL